MKVLALDISTSTTGYAIVDSSLQVREYGQFAIKDRTLSDTMYALEITKKVMAIGKKYNITNVIIEDVYYGKNISSLKTWCRVHGAVSVAWYIKYKKEPLFIMAMTARKKIGINGKAKKIEIQLEMSKKHKLIKNTCYTTYFTKFKELVEIKLAEYVKIEKSKRKKIEQKIAKRKVNTKFNYQVNKLSKQFEKETKISEHHADSMVLGEAFFK